jgi:hypothetical protein
VDYRLKLEEFDYRQYIAYYKPSYCVFVPLANGFFLFTIYIMTMQATLNTISLPCNEAALNIDLLLFPWHKQGLLLKICSSEAQGVLDPSTFS